MSLTPIDRILSTSNLLLFFSLPFRPVKKRNLFFTGHVALGLEDKAYQVYNPRLLKSPFLFSVMPVRDWLFGKGGKWVERNPESPRFKYVYLYGKSESKRTVVYCAGTTVGTDAMERMQNELIRQEDQFRSGGFRYGLFTNNCSMLIAQILVSANLIQQSPRNLVPAFLFKSFAETCRHKPDMEVGKIAAYERERFRLHHLCAGLWGIHPEKAMDQWVHSGAEPGGGRRSTK